jgi:DNA-binding winged helix-turn-helix (wHTH) protein
VLRFAGFTLDRQRAELRGPEGRIVRLRPKTLDMLSHLAARSGQVLSKQQLMDAVWPNVHVGEDNLFQCIRELRTALGDSDRQLIKLVSGRGYVFEAEVIAEEPAVDDGRLYFGAYNSVGYCLDATTGAEIWRQACAEWVGASPLVVARHGFVFIGLEYERPWAQGGLAALDIKTGHKVWEHPVKKCQHGSPAYWESGDLIIWGSADHDMVGIEAKTGKMAWALKTRRSVKYAPSIDAQRGLVAFASFDKSIYVADAATGAKRGEWQTGEICYTTPLFFGNKLFCGSGDRHLYVIDLDNMTLIARLDMGARIFSSPRIVANRVVFGTTGGRVIELDPETLEVAGVLQLPDAVTNAVAATADGTRMFVSTYMNHLFAFERLR